MDLPLIPNEASEDDFRCCDCGKLLAKLNEPEIALKIKCARCGALNSIFRGVSDQVIITDPEGVILYANAAVETTTGYSLAEVLGKKPSLWGRQMPQEFYRDLWKIIKIDKKPVKVVVRNKRKDGSLYSAKLNISPVFDSAGEISMFVAIESAIDKPRVQPNMIKNDTSTDSAG